MMINSYIEKIKSGQSLSREEAIGLVDADLEELCAGADELREHFFKNIFDPCAVLSVKGGRCSEDCAFCGQAIGAKTEIPTFKLLDTEAILNGIDYNNELGIRHYCLVSSGKRLSKADVQRLCESIKKAKGDIKLCASLGLLDEEDFKLLKEAGITRIHNNLETSPAVFEKLCHSHSYEEKINTLKAARSAGLEICCGGIIGVGETMLDRIELAMIIREFEPASVPINLLSPVKGTPMGDMKPLHIDEIRRCVAIFRFIIPKAFIRLAAGRNFIPDTGLSCFKAGANAAISGDCLTVKGISAQTDLENIRELGYLF